MAMRFEHEFTVPVPVEQAWAVLLDVERVAPCLPGAALDSVEGERFTGRMKVKVGPITVTYRGSAAFEDVDKDAHTLAIKASGKEARGSGTASATVKARLTPVDGATSVTVETSFNVTGRPAQFGRGVMAEVGAKLIDRFAANLADLFAEPAQEEAAAGPGQADPGTGQVDSAAGRHLTAVPGSGDETRPSGATSGEDDPGSGVTRTPGKGDAQSSPRASGPDTSGDQGSSPASGDQRSAGGSGSRRVPPVSGEDAHPSGAMRTSRTPDEEALDLLDIAGAPLLKRLAPVLGGIAALVVIVWVIRRLVR